MTKTQHVHKFRRLKYKTGNAIFFCALPDCNFKINTALALGKRSLCWRCNEPFIMNEYSLRLAKPHCENCHKPKNSMIVKEEAAVDSITRIIDHAHELPKEALSLSERLQKALNMNKKESESDI